MGSLAPLFLLAAASVALPLWLHLLHRHQARRMAFPAIRYLDRTERDHAVRIRMRQLLLLLLRVVVLLLVVGAGARLYVVGGAGAHPPTAVVLVIDNSASSGVIVDGERLLDRLKAAALHTVAAATPDDRIWILRAGEPWEPAVTVDPEEARAILASVEVSAAGGDLGASLERAEQLLATSSLQVGEIHLLSDLQASAFDHGHAHTRPSVAVIAWVQPDESPGNHGIAQVTIGGGLAPVEGERSDLTVRVGGSAAADIGQVGVRVLLDGRIRGATSIPPAMTATLPLPSFGSGWVRGWVESDPDALRADDRFAFTFRARQPPTVRTNSHDQVLLAHAVGVLTDAGRLRHAASAPADLLIGVSGEGVASPGLGGAVMVVPPADRNELPALNRRLADAGIPWRYRSGAPAGEAALSGEALPPGLEGIVVRECYDLGPASGLVEAGRVLARIGTDPWLVEGTTPAGDRYLLLASSFAPEATSLPVTPGMIRFVHWAAARWADPGTGPISRTAGEPLGAPPSATHVRLPNDSVVAIDGTRSFAATALAGFYTFLSGDSLIAVEALNPPEWESVLAPLGSDRLTEFLGPEAAAASTVEEWEQTVFRTRQGPELWWPLLLAALALLMIETLAAASRGTAIRRKADA